MKTMLDEMAKGLSDAEATEKSAIADFEGLIAAKTKEVEALTTAIEEKTQRVGQLSPREREVLSGVSEGYSSKEVARTLGISPRTVELHRANVLTKLGVRNVAAAVRLSVEAQLDAGPAVTQERELAL